MLNKVIFLDRDGTINEEINYLYKKDEFIFISGVVKAIKIFHQLGYKVIVITNQAGVARGYYSENDIEILHKYLDELLRLEGTYIDAYYYCPHHPEGTIEDYKGKCECRKPNIGMIEQAAKDFDISLEDSIIVGDKEIDVQTGKNSGIGKCILVRSGHSFQEDETTADIIFDKLYDFAVDLRKKYYENDKSNNQ